MGRTDKTLRWRRRRLLVMTGVLFIFSMMAGADVAAPPGWRTESPRTEIRPAFHFASQGGRSRTGAFAIEADDREGLHGAWVKDVPIKGEKHYRFSACRK